ncbi:hypothetical protein HK099_004027 [Clydaea vesicula]|uniref:Uncharacterized protein n=1 Tax=Clydaea vesicula TaxID=447962 RepID=A0AAD5U2G1_9FUNG|nr:hypothetical protein HK099_004027 [Clydaea vesicula]
MKRSKVVFVESRYKTQVKVSSKQPAANNVNSSNLGTQKASSSTTPTSKSKTVNKSLKSTKQLSTVTLKESSKLNATSVATISLKNSENFKATPVKESEKENINEENFATNKNEKNFLPLCSKSALASSSAKSPTVSKEDEIFISKVKLLQVHYLKLKLKKNLDEKIQKEILNLKKYISELLIKKKKKVSTLSLNLNKKKFLFNQVQKFDLIFSSGLLEENIEEDFTSSQTAAMFSLYEALFQLVKNFVFKFELIDVSVVDIALFRDTMYSAAVEIQKLLNASGIDEFMIFSVQFKQFLKVMEEKLGVIEDCLNVKEKLQHLNVIQENFNIEKYFSQRNSTIISELL